MADEQQSRSDGINTGQSAEGRLRSFAVVFKGYMGIMPIVAAAIAPILTAGKVLPMYPAQANRLAMLSGLTGFLIVAYAFYSRDVFARIMFLPAHSSQGTPTIFRRTLVRLLPLIFALGSGLCFLKYIEVFKLSVDASRANWLWARSDLGSKLNKPGEDLRAIEQLVQLEPSYGVRPLKEVIEQADDIPFERSLSVYYVLAFVFAEIAFVVMALREHLQDVLKISELEFIFGSAKDGGTPSKTTG